MENILIEIPIEVQNRITTQALMCWVSNFAGLISSADYKKNIIELYEKKEGEKYFAGERSKQKISELELQIEQLKKQIK